MAESNWAIQGELDKKRYLQSCGQDVGTLMNGMVPGSVSGVGGAITASGYERMRGGEVTGAWREGQPSRSWDTASRPDWVRIERGRVTGSAPAPHPNKARGLSANAVHGGGTGRQVLGRVRWGGLTKRTRPPIADLQSN